MQILALRAKAEALVLLGQTAPALSTVRRALDVLQASDPDARVQHAALLAQRARIERAAGDDNTLAATLAEARALAVPAAQLAAADAATLQLH